MRSLADVIAFNQQRRGEEMPYFQQELLERAQAKGPLTEKAYLVVAPTAGPAPRHTAIPGEPEWPVCTKPAAVAGYPHVTVPAGLVNGLPVGISFFGPAWSEPVMLKLVYAFEQATRARRRPAFARSAGA